MFGTVDPDTKNSVYISVSYSTENNDVLRCASKILCSWSQQYELMLDYIFVHVIVTCGVWYIFWVPSFLLYI